MDIPPEIIDVILSFLHEDTTTLLHCALVSRVWLRASRPFCKPFCAVDSRPSSTPRLLTLLNHSNCSFKDLVTRLTVYELLDRSDVDLSGHPKWLADVMITLASHLAYIEHLVVGYTFIERDFPIPLTFSQFRSVTKLELYSIELVSVSQLFDIVCTMPNLHSLGLDDAGWESELVEDKQTKLFPIGLNSMRIGECYKRDILSNLLPDNQYRGCVVETLDLGLVRPTDTPIIGQYLQFLGPSLAHLHVGFSSLDSGGDAGEFESSQLGLSANFLMFLEDFYNACDLTANPQLKTLSFNRLVYHSDYQLTSAVPWIFAMLLRILPRPTLQVIFVLDVTSMDDLTRAEYPIDWKALDALITRGESESAKLGSLLFRIRDVESVDAARQISNFISAKLPRFEASRGILEVAIEPLNSRKRPTTFNNALKLIPNCS